MRRTIQGGFSQRRVRALLGISRSLMEALALKGLVSPSRGARLKQGLTFRDVKLLQTAYALQRAQVPARRIVRSLVKLRHGLPAEVPLTRMELKANGVDVTVREPHGYREVESGQLVLALDSPEQSSPAPQAQAAAPHGPTPLEWVSSGDTLREADPAAAAAAYRRALQAQPGLTEAALNLAALLISMGQPDAALEACDAALAEAPQPGGLWFNRALALEDLGQIEKALASYRHCLELDPAIAEAHQNLAEIHLARGDTVSAMRHLSALRRLDR